MASTWIGPVIDRTQADVDRIQELNNIGYFNMTDDQKAEWLQDSKGALNQSDLLRIENNIQFLSDLFDLDLTTYDQNIPEIPMTPYYANLRANVQAIRDTGHVQWNTPAVPSSPLNTFQKWNNIEKILFDAHNTLDDNVYYGQYGAEDEIYSGEDAGLVL